MNKVTSYVFFNQKTGNLRTGWKVAGTAALGVFLLAHATASFGQGVKILRGNFNDLVKSGLIRDGDTIFFRNKKVMDAAKINVYYSRLPDLASKGPMISTSGSDPRGCEMFCKYSRGDAVTVTTVYKDDKIIKGAYQETILSPNGKQFLCLKSISGINYSIPLNAITDISFGY